MHAARHVDWGRVYLDLTPVLCTPGFRQSATRKSATKLSLKINVMLSGRAEVAGRKHKSTKAGGTAWVRLQSDAPAIGALASWKG
jgi:hypothetical protein